ncbi:extracellular solute-binding protein [Ruminococcaceae bacterium OttesenSCG-928-L11]|nr:extracellular solute-binding protein [Ruminococcaceae bacterium OttesenSCG-928-L11]
MKKTRLTMVAASILAVLLVLSACGQSTQQPTSTAAGGSSAASPSATAQSSQSAQPAEDSNFNELGTFPIVKEKETINVYHSLGEPEFDVETNWMTQYYEEKTNIHVVWNMHPVEQYKEKVNLAFASSEQIDFVVAGGSPVTSFSRTDVMKYAEQGVILPINDLLENHSIHMKEQLDAYEGWREIITLPDGNIYAMPRMNECYHCMYYGKMWINQEFLKNVGLENPTTIEEFHTMLLAFRDQDANGNGDPNDEIPMIGAIDTFGSKIDTYLMSAFIYDDGENRLFLRDGTVTAAFAQPEFQEGLKYLNMLFNDDLIYKESFTQTRDVRNKINSQKYESICGAMPNTHHVIGTREVDEPARWLDYKAIPPLVGPNGLQTTRYDYYNNFQSERTAGLIPDTCKDPALIMRWLDWFMSEEGTTMLILGEEGLGWEQPDPGSTGVDGTPATYKIKVLKPGDDYYKTWCGISTSPTSATRPSAMASSSPTI